MREHSGTQERVEKNFVLKILFQFCKILTAFSHRMLTEREREIKTTQDRGTGFYF